MGRPGRIESGRWCTARRRIVLQPSPESTGGLRVLMGIVFYPRGGSAQVVRYLSRALTERGHEVTVASGSLKGAEAGGGARSFYSGLPLLEVDYTEAVKAFHAGGDPMSPELAVPMAPRYEG